MEKLVEQIKAQYALFAENAEAQVSKNNKAAGTRARKAALIQWDGCIRAVDVA